MSSEPNKVVAREALTQPEILAEIAVGLDWDDPKLVGDCAEVFTEVAKVKPALVAPYVADLIPLLPHPSNALQINRFILLHRLGGTRQLADGPNHSAGNNHRGDNQQGGQHQHRSSRRPCGGPAVLPRLVRQS